MQSRTEHRGNVTSLAYAPDGKLLASDSWDQSIRLWDTTSKDYAQLGGQIGEITSVAFAADGETLASGSGDKSVRLWEVRTGRCLRIFRGHEGRVSSIAFSP